MKLEGDDVFQDYFEDHDESSCSQEVLTAEEAADFLRIDRKTLYDAANRGEIPHRRIGRRLLFGRRVLMAWLNQCKVA